MRNLILCLWVWAVCTDYRVGCLCVFVLDGSGVCIVFFQTHAYLWLLSVCKNTINTPEPLCENLCFAVGVDAHIDPQITHKFTLIRRERPMCHSAKLARRLVNVYLILARSDSSAAALNSLAQNKIHIPSPLRRICVPQQITIENS